MLLIIDKSERAANTVSNIFGYMGILSNGTTPEHALAEFTNRHKAVIFIRPELTKNIEQFVNLVRTYSLDADVFAVTSPKHARENRKLFSVFDAVFEAEAISTGTVSDILAFANERDKGAIGSYRVLGIDASINNPVPTYFDTPVPLTKTEAMILRFLIASYPIPRAAEDILKYVFCRGRYPEPSSIRTYISLINRSFRNVIGKSVISFVRGKGYVIKTS